MAMQMVTPAIRERAVRLAEESSSWLPAVSRVSGKRFYIVPSSTGSAAHYTNFHGCTCNGFLHRNICAHVEAIRLVERRRMAELAAEAAFQAENDALFFGYERHETPPNNEMTAPKAAPRFSKGYADLFGPDDDTVDAF